MDIARNYMLLTPFKQLIDTDGRNNHKHSAFISRASPPCSSPQKKPGIAWLFSITVTNYPLVNANSMLLKRFTKVAGSSS